MPKVTHIALSGALALSALFATAGVSQAQSQQLVCENGSPMELVCTYHRDANGNIVLHECKWSC